MIVIQTVAQYAFWRRYQQRYPGRLTGSPYLAGWDRMTSDPQQGLWYRVSLLFAPIEDAELDRTRRRALHAMSATVVVTIALVAWAIVN